MRKIINLCFVFLVCFNTSVFSQFIEKESRNGRGDRHQQTDYNVNQGFIENKGQIFDEAGKFRSDVYFVSYISGTSVFFTNEGVVFYFKKIELSEYEKIRFRIIPNPYSDKEWESIRKQISDDNYKGELLKSKGEFYRIDISFPGATLISPIGENEMLEKRNYFNPQHPDGLMDVPVFENIRYSNIYPGIDLVFYVKSGKLKYDFEISAGANPSLIKILYKGHENISIDKEGNAIVKILPGEIVENSPVSIQNGEIIESQFLVSNDTIMFKLGKYDSMQPITIDPSLTWSTYFHDGTTSAAFSYTNPVWDSKGNMFIVQNTYNTTVFPIINPGGAYTQTGSTGLQLTIMKFNPSKQIVWSTYYASSQSTQVSYTNQSVAIDQNDNLYIVGNVSNGSSGTFPLYNMGGGAYYETEQGNGRDFILKFTSLGTRLWATMFNKTSGTSSSGLDITGIAIDNNNKLVMTGETYTPPSWNPMPLVNPGGSYYYRGTSAEASVPTLHRFSSSGVLEWSTYICQGTSGAYNGNYTAIDIDASNNIFLGGSGSGSYTTVNPGGAYVEGTACGNGRKIQIFKFASTGALNWCTLYGGTYISGAMLWQDCRDLKVAPNGDVVLVGRANATNFPWYNPGGGAYYKNSLSAGSSSVCDGLILQFSNNGVRKWATYCGGDGSSDGTDFWGLGIDANNNIFVSGLSRTTSSFPTQFLSGSYNQATQTGDFAIVLAQFNISGVKQWASYFGNKTWTWCGGFGLYSDVCGTKMVQCGSADYAYTITTVDPGGGAYYNSAKEGVTGQTDFIAEFANFNPISAPTSATANPSSVCSGTTTNITLTASGGEPGSGGVAQWFTGGCGNTLVGTGSPLTISQTLTSSTTYYVRYSGSCGITDCISTIVNVTPNITPSFTAMGPYCSGSIIPSLPTTSNNGITGTWSPAINNTATTTYTFTPSAGQCATTASMTITISPNVTPTFSAVGPYCSGATISALPTTSNNGITGTWSPAINNTATTTYTFTPSAGQCATTASMTITISPNVTPTFSAVGPYCSGATISALPNTSNNGITGTWSPAINNTATTTYTFTPSAGQCATTASMTITISPNVTPTFSAVGPYCSGATISALPNTSNNGITGTWSPAINNTATTTYTFTPSAGQCATTASMTITISPNVTPTFSAVGPYCSGSIIPSLPTTSNNGITGTWSPAINNTATTTYTFTPSAGQCATTASMTITISPNVTPTFSAVGPYCSGSIIPSLPTTSNNGITGTWSPAINNTATTTYTFTPSAGQCATTASMTITISPNVTPTFSAVGPYCSGSIIPSLPTTSNNGITGTWSPAINNTATTTYTWYPNIRSMCYNCFDDNYN